MADATKAKRKVITHPDQLPDFSKLTWEEEDEFWRTHDFAEGVFEEGPEVDAELDGLLGIDRSKDGTRTK
jgi:hypothetical protein